MLRSCKYAKKTLGIDELMQILSLRSKAHFFKWAFSLERRSDPLFTPRFLPENRFTLSKNALNIE